jgi:hypothetical protein
MKFAAITTFLLDKDFDNFKKIFEVYQQKNGTFAYKKLIYKIAPIFVETFKDDAAGVKKWIAFFLHYLTYFDLKEENGRFSLMNIPISAACYSVYDKIFDRFIGPSRKRADYISIAAHAKNNGLNFKNDIYPGPAFK